MGPLSGHFSCVDTSIRYQLFYMGKYVKDYKIIKPSRCTEKKSGISETTIKSEI